MRGCARAGLICYSLLDAARPKENLLILLPTWPRLDPEAESSFIPRKKEKKINLHEVKWPSPEQQPPVKPVQAITRSPSLHPSSLTSFIPSFPLPSRQMFNSCFWRKREEEPSLSGDNWLLLQHQPPPPPIILTPSAFNGISILHFINKPFLSQH